jgi:ankyrin repeat protein
MREDTDESGATALIEAAEYGDPLAIDLLLAHGPKHTGS